MSRRRNLVFATFILLLLWLFPSYNISWHPLFSSPSLGWRQGPDFESCTENVLLPRSQRELSRSASTQVETTIPGSELITGFTLLDRIYLRNGTFFVVTSNRSMFPPRSNMISPGIDIGVGNDMEPTDKELLFLDKDEVKTVLGPHAIRIEGFSVVVYDPKQFMPHFYHWWGEIVLGAWRVYSALFTTDIPPPPARFILPFVHNSEWRDRAGLSAPLMRAAFPSAAIENEVFWQDLAMLDKTFVFDRAMIVSRETSTRHPFSERWYKMISPTMAINPIPTFFEPIRRTAITSLIGYLPVLSERGTVSTLSDNDNVETYNVRTDLPIVTYVSRQDTGRRLLSADHDGLVRALRSLEEEGVCEVIVVEMEGMTLAEQLAVVARSTVLVGVHGNGMTHQLWMPPSPLSTVIEIFIPNGYTFDYEMLARNMGHMHYAVWNDTLITFPKGTFHEGVNYPDDFHSSLIPVHGPSVAQVIRQRLMGDS